VENGTIVDRETGERAVARLLADHLTDARLAPAAKALGRVAGVRGEERTVSDLTRILDGSPHAAVRAEALFRRGMLRQETEKSQARQDLERAVAEAPDSDAGKKAAEKLAASTPLAVGDPAPDFEGRTLSGGTLKLSALRGRIVLVDFWGMWCGPCVAQLPKLRQLRERFNGKPFEIVGIDSDADLEALRRFVAANRIDWITVLDGSTDGPVAKSWRLDAWPASFLVDGEGVIRERNPDLDSLAARIAEKLAKVTPPSHASGTGPPPARGFPRP
jgi:peroxiredoxin